MQEIIRLLNKIIDMLGGAEPDRPSLDYHDKAVGEVVKEAPVRKPYNMPVIVYHDIKVPIKGGYKTKSGKCKGWMIHFTAGWNTSGATNAINTIKDMAKRGLYCPVMDRDGVIHASKYAVIDGDYAYHAGRGVWHSTGSLSKYVGGMEICNGGKLLDNGKTWFGHKPLGTRKVAAKDNVKAGIYEVYTPKQEQALMDFICWQLDVNPECEISWILGHDEYAPDRKNDPGGALSMTMPKFREMLRKKMR